MSFETELLQLCNQGLKFQDCVAAFALPAYENPFVSKARELQVKGRSEVDKSAPILAEPTGAWVLSWMWITNKEAGVITRSELVDQILAAVKVAMAQSKPATASLVENYQHKQQQAYLGWLDGLSTEKKEKLNTVEKEGCSSTAPHACEGTIDDQAFVFYPTQALMVLNSMALMGGFPLQRHLETQTFLLSNEQSINAVLSQFENKPVSLVSNA